MSHSTISTAEINEAQQLWAEGLVAIGQAYSANENYQELAEQLLLKLYALDYGNGTILFKPTLATEKPFRKNKDGALSYFIGDNAEYAEDQGFALKKWRSVEFDNSEILFREDIAIAIGSYHLESESGQKTTAHYTFGYVKDDAGEIKVILHHSSLPYMK